MIDHIVRAWRYLLSRQSKLTNELNPVTGVHQLWMICVAQQQQIEALTRAVYVITEEADLRKGLVEAALKILPLSGDMPAILDASCEDEPDEEEFEGIIQIISPTGASSYYIDTEYEWGTTASRKEARVFNDPQEMEDMAERFRNSEFFRKNIGLGARVITRCLKGQESKEQETEVAQPVPSTSVRLPLPILDAINIKAILAAAEIASPSGDHHLTHPRDSNNWKANREWTYVASPKAFEFMNAYLEHLAVNLSAMCEMWKMQCDAHGWDPHHMPAYTNARKLLDDLNASQVKGLMQ